MSIQRRQTPSLWIGKVEVGGSAPVSIQSMTTTRTTDIRATVAQISELATAGCDIVRVAVPDEASSHSLAELVPLSPLPVVADIHFNHTFALRALDAGVHGLRINPGNIGSAERIASVVEKARSRNVPIRIGVNAGSLEKDILQRHGHPGPEAMVESGLRHIALLEKLNYRNMKISLKASDVYTTMQAYRLIASKVPYPLHLGVTEAGTEFGGTVKSAIGIGGLLSEGIGDTIRVSLTADPVREIRVARKILQSLGLRREGVNFVSCPTCGRVEVDLVSLANRVEEALQHIPHPITVAVMGCPVNGPGEAREADYGIAGGKGRGLVMHHGEVVGWFPEDQLVETLLALIHKDFPAPSDFA
nr:flavodoxin-dependent (E)-4-hydroxy-3-methylbut-2-enyl-diphosphate synthase [Desulfurispirillum indicum]